MLLGAGDVAIAVCLQLSSQGCLPTPVPLEAEVVASTPSPAAVSWWVDGQVVHRETLPMESFQPKQLLLLLEPWQPAHRVRLVVEAAGALGVAEVQLERLCPFAVELELLQEVPAGVRAVLRNQGPFASSPGRLLWLVNAQKVASLPLAPLPVGGSLELLLPAAHLPRPLAVRGRAGKAKRGSLVSLAVELGPGSLVPPRQQWDLWVGLLEEKRAR